MNSSLPIPVLPVLSRASVLVERIGAEGWLVRRSDAAAQRWVVLCHGLNDPGRQLAINLVNAAVNENWWVLAIPASREYDADVALLHGVISSTGQQAHCGRDGIPHFYLLGCGEGAVVARRYTSHHPQRVIGLALLPGADFAVASADGAGVTGPADGAYGLLRTPMQVYLPLPAKRASGDALVATTAAGWVRGVESWLNQLRRMACRRGIRLDCSVVGVADNITLPPRDYLQRVTTLAALVGFFQRLPARGDDPRPLASAGSSALKFLL